MVSEEFKKLYNNLNPSQKEAVDSIEGAVMVIAGPGTGKTQILTLRIANILLKTQINPENILALTFTEAASFEMRKRLLSIIGNDAYRVEITTFHSFCNNLIKQYQEEFAHIIASVNINEIEQLQIIEQCLNSLSLKILRPLGDTKYYLKPLLNAINELKRENISPKLLEKALEDFKKNLDETSDLYHEKGAHKGKMKSIYQKSYKDLEKNQELLMVFKAYQKKLFENKKYDYNDMLLEVIQKLMQQQYLLQLLQEKFQYFLVDEHQDTNAAQNKIVELLCDYFENPNLFVVGDEKQAIFRFQGATLENFLYFKKLYPEARLINLSENYRSTQTILNATHSVINNNPKLIQVLSKKEGLIKKALHKEEKIQVVGLSSPDLEYLWVGEEIKRLRDSLSGHKIAVLARNNKDLDPLVSIFDHLNIPYIVESDRNILDDLDIQKLILLLRVISDPLKNRNEYVKKALLLDCFKIQPIDVFKLIRAAYEKKLFIWDIINDEKMLDELSLKSKKEIKNFADLFANQEKGLIKKTMNKRLDGIFVETLNRSGLMKRILEKQHGQEILNRIKQLYDEVGNEIKKNPLFSLSDFLKYIDLLEENNISLKQNAHIIPENIVRLMTVHKSKGLEFDYVFVINAYDGHWGNSRKRGSIFHIPCGQLGLRLDQELGNEQNSDERRLFYVALTRARKKIFLSYSLTSQDGREQIPSQFISEIPEKFIEKADVVKFEKDLLNHQEKLLELNKEDANKKSLLLSKTYIAELFRRQGLSVSALNNYIECPWKFFFLNLLRLPEVISDSGLFGNAVHFALNQYIISLKKKTANENLLLKFFKEELLRQPIDEKDINSFLERGEKALKGYYKEQIKFWNKDVVSELDIRGVNINNDVVLNGKIDMIEPIGKNLFNVYDFKTGEPKSRDVIEGNTKTSNGNYKRQLIFYKILLDNFKNGFFKMQNGIIEFIEPNEKEIYKHEVFLIAKEETDQLLKQIVDVGNQIINFSFLNTNCDDKECKYCKLRSFM
ncbi:ATP-dependent helicase [Candidatus Microgenomates bacterium]|nr:MAG: ATP-dependent helicase [Candidatus Microgenomates bacterium]